jgi:hypothetical protein
VWLAQADGSGARELGIGESADLAPDGSTVAAIPWGFAGTGITLFSSDGQIKGRFFNAAVVSAYPVAWSSDSRYLAVTMQYANTHRDGLVVIDTTTRRVALIARGGIAGVSFAPSGSDRLVFGRSASVDFKQPTNLFLASPNGRRVRQLTHDVWSSDPAWGARGIAFNHAPGHNGASSINQVWMMQPDGRDRRAITRFTTRRLADGLTPLQFSADGTRLLAACYGGPNDDETWTLDLVSRRIRRLTIGGQNVIADAISRDGQLVLVERPRPDALNNTIEMVGFAGGDPVVLAHGQSASWNR